MAWQFTARVLLGSDLAARGVSRLVCQRQFSFEENSGDMVSSLREVNVPGRTHFYTDSCMSGRSAFTALAARVLVICVACMWSTSLT